jgi:hypothetical protein
MPEVPGAPSPYANVLRRVGWRSGHITQGSAILLNCAHVCCVLECALLRTSHMEAALFASHHYNSSISSILILRILKSAVAFLRLCARRSNDEQKYFSQQGSSPAFVE